MFSKEPQGGFLRIGVDMSDKSVSVIVPCYNEANRKNFENHIRSIITEMDYYSSDFEIILVNDGSTDNTLDILKNFEANNVKVINNATNRGKGFSIRKGIENSEKDYVLFMDADLSVPLYFISRAMQKLEEYDCVIASRYIKGATITSHRGIIRSFISLILRMIFLGLFGLSFKDTQCGFKIFKKEIVDLSVFKCDRWLFDIELLTFLTEKGYKVFEMPVIWNNNTDSTLNSLDAIKTSIEEVKYILNLKRRLNHDSV